MTVPVLNILLVDDEHIIRESMGRYLRKCGHHVGCAGDGIEALEEARNNPYDVALIDLRMPRMDGFTLLEKLQQVQPDTATVIVTGHADVDAAVQALRGGVDDFLRKPVQLSELDAVLNRLGKSALLKRENRHLRGAMGHIQSNPPAPGTDAFLGVSPAAISVREQVDLAATSPCDTVLVTGETGVGKEVVAREIHRKGSGDERPFIAVNCPAIAASLLESELFGHAKGTFTGATANRDGAFHLADGGTLLLDEIADLSAQAQAAILRTVETRHVRRVGGDEETPVELRLITASNADLQQLVRDKRFRKDLYYRLDAFRIHIPPLRERPEDVLLLAEHLLDRFVSARGLGARRFTPDAAAALFDYDYPGNVRELRNVVERAAVICRGETIEAEHLALNREPHAAPAHTPTPAPSPDDDEKTRIEDALTRSRWNRRKAASMLGVSYSTLREKIAKYGLA